jgi:hypothetical protein
MVNGNWKELYQSLSVYAQGEKIGKDLTTKGLEGLYWSLQNLVKNSVQWWDLVMKIHKEFMPLLQKVPELPDSRLEYPSNRPIDEAQMIKEASRVEKERKEEMGEQEEKFETKKREEIGGEGKGGANAEEDGKRFINYYCQCLTNIVSKS